MDKIYIYKGMKITSLAQLKDWLFKDCGLILPAMPSDDLLLLHQVKVEYLKQPEYNIEQLRQSKLNELKTLFNQKRQSSHIYFESSLGFRVNANETSVINIQQLCNQLEFESSANYRTPNDEFAIYEDKKKMFKTFDNNYVGLSLYQLQVLRYEIGLSGELFYQAYWKKCEQLMQAKTFSELSLVELTLPDCMLLPA